MSWQREFGADYQIPPQITENLMFVDRSWHNDMCPCFTVRGAGATVFLWVEHVNPARREDPPERDRFCVVLNKIDPRFPDETTEEISIILSTNDVAAAVTAALMTAEIHKPPIA